MRAWFVLLLVVPMATALLDDPAGDVAISHCDVANTPLPAFEAMDLRGLILEEHPDGILLRVSATGLTEEGGLESGNYVVHFQRGEQHYAVRMFQDNTGTAAIAQVIASQGVSLIGTTIAELPADVDGATNSIETYVPRHILRNQDHAPLDRGHAMDNIVVSAEAHATGLYACFVQGSGGPAIIKDRMPDAWLDGAVSVTMQTGGVDASGPIDLRIQNAYRASNGEETTYAYPITVSNLDAEARSYTLRHEVPDGWTFTVPNGTLLIPAGANATFSAYLHVPFVHEHGATHTGTLTVETEGASANADFGVHHMTTPQPAGHHPNVYIHSTAALGLGTELTALAGGGDHHMYWNTLEDDDADHGLPISSQTVGGDLLWYGCLTPDLAMGLHPTNGTGAFTLEFTSDVAVAGTLTGSIGTLADGARPATCHDAREWVTSPVLMLDPVDVSFNGAATIEGTISAFSPGPIDYAPGSDLLLEIRITPTTTFPLGGVVDLLTGGRLTLPLQDYHEPTAVVPVDDDQQFVPTTAPEPKESPGLPLVALLVVLAAFGKRRLK